jgi:hypothetical protein
MLDVYLYLYVHVYVHVNFSCMCMCMCTYTCMCKRMCVCVCVLAHMYVYLHICIFMCTHAHTHICTIPTCTPSHVQEYTWHDHHAYMITLKSLRIHADIHIICMYVWAYRVRACIRPRKRTFLMCTYKAAHSWGEKSCIR